MSATNSGHGRGNWRDGGQEMGISLQVMEKRLPGSRWSSRMRRG